MAKAKTETKTETQVPLAVIAREPIRHDGADYAIGDTLEVTPEAAAALEAAGAIEPGATA